MNISKNGNKIIVEDARILWPNFSGLETDYNRKGDRNFALVIPDEELANMLIGYGINVKRKENPQDPTDVLYFVPVKIKYKDDLRDPRNPKGYLVSYPNATLLTPETIGTIDEVIRSGNAECINIDINMYAWTLKNGQSGVSLYMENIEVIMRTDRFRNKYTELGYNVQ